MSNLVLHRTHTFSPKNAAVLEKLHYLVYEPPGWADEARPFLLFLHGMGERGERVEQVARHGIPREIELGKNLPFVAVSPQCPKDKTWDQLTPVLLELIDDLIPRYKLDPRRIYLTGMSMGGFGVWKLAASAPERFAALVPVCGGGDPKTAPRLQTLPTWAFHGAQDDIVPATRTQVMVDALQAIAAPIRLTLYPDLGHDCWTRTYEGTEVYDWMLGQRRGSVDASARLNAEHGPHIQ